MVLVCKYPCIGVCGLGLVLVLGLAIVLGCKYMNIEMWVLGLRLGLFFRFRVGIVLRSYYLSIGVWVLGLVLGFQSGFK